MITKKDLKPPDYIEPTMEPRIAISLLRSAEKLSQAVNVDRLLFARALAERVLEHGGEAYQKAHDLIRRNVKERLPDAWEIFWAEAPKKSRKESDDQTQTAP